MRIPKAVQHLIESFEKLPGVGPKSAQRLTFYLLHVPQQELDNFASALQNLKTQTKLCSICKSIDETDPCSICADVQRDHTTICVVEQPLDVLALEKSGIYKGVYHVLHGRIDPLNNLGPDEIYMQQLFDRLNNVILGSEVTPESGVEKDSGQARMTVKVQELILATNPTMEGEATAMYIGKYVKSHNPGTKLTRIGRGLPVGADLEYADEITLQRAMEGRNEM